MWRTYLGGPGEEEEAVITLSVHLKVVLDRGQQVAVARQLPLQQQDVDGGVDDLRPTHVTHAEHQTRMAASRTQDGCLAATASKPLCYSVRRKSTHCASSHALKLQRIFSLTYAFIETYVLC